MLPKHPSPSSTTPPPPPRLSKNETCILYTTLLKYIQVYIYIYIYIYVYRNTVCDNKLQIPIFVANSPKLKSISVHCFVVVVGYSGAIPKTQKLKFGFKF